MATKSNEKTTEKRQAILWGRFSSDQQKDGDSKASQDRYNKECAIRNGIEVIGEYFDEGVSVKEGVTPNFLKILKDLPKGVGIICRDLDRINRGHSIDAQYFLKHSIIDKGHFVITSTDNIEYNEETIKQASTLIIGGMKTTIAYGENEKRIRGVRDAKASAIQLAREGKPSPLGAWLPSHLKYNFDTKQYDILPDKVQVIETIYSEYINGNGTSKIAKKLNAEKVPTFNSKRIGGWNKSTIRELLMYEGVIGTLNIKGERIPNAFPPAIKEKTFYKVQSMLSANKDRHGNYASETINNVFRGKMHCAHCGASMKVYKRRVLACTGYRIGRCKVKTMITFRQMESELIRWFVHKAYEHLMKDETKADLQALQAQEALLTKRIDEALEDYENPEMPRDRIKPRLLKLEAARRKVQSEINAAKVVSSNATGNMLVELQSLINTMDQPETRKRIAAIVPSLIKDIKIDFADRKKASFVVEMMDGTKVDWMYAHQSRFNGKITEGFYEVIP